MDVHVARDWWTDREASPYLALAIAVAAVSWSAILIRYSSAPSVVKAFYRVFFMAAFVAPAALARDRAAFGRLGRRDLAAAVLAGVALAAHFATWFESLEWTSVAASATLVQVQPVFVAVGAALFLDERVGRRTVWGILVAVAGAATMSLAGASGPVAGAGNAAYGNALAVVGAVMAAGYVLAGRSLRQRVPFLPYVTVVFGACAVALLGLSLARGAPLASYPPHEWGLFLAMAVGPGLLGHALINWALEHVESSVVSVSLLGEPVGSTLLALALLSEVPGPLTVAGGAVVLTGIYVTTTAGDVDETV